MSRLTKHYLVKLKKGSLDVPKQLISGLKSEKAADLDDLEFGKAKGAIAIDSIHTSRHLLRMRASL
jgi:hypothetical protein